MARFLLPPEHWETGELTGDEARHLTQVLRIKAGKDVVVFDGKGRRASAKVISANRDHVALELGDSTTLPAPKPNITLVQAIPKGKNMDLIVQKAVELGVASIQPIVTHNTVVQPGEGKSDKWRRTALEACKQCGQDTLPIIGEPMTFDAWLKTSPQESELKIIASLAPGAKPMRDTLRDHPSTTSASLLIGPEGDFTQEETQSAIDAGFLPVTLGEIVLRVETATLFCISSLRYEFSSVDR